LHADIDDVIFLPRTALRNSAYASFFIGLKGFTMKIKSKIRAGRGATCGGGGTGGGTGTGGGGGGSPTHPVLQN